MSSRIRILSDHTINKIAAGEVIENPASVVKELVENAVDAGSTEVVIEVRAGGRQLIRVSDNGRGMGRDDALLCLERHATSKIREAEEITAIETLGFRGEALPSIAAISKFSLITAEPTKSEEETTEGTMIIVEGGTVRHCSSVVRSPGTTIEVKSLFYNVPVRRKFQRSPSYDQNEIRKLLTRLAMAMPSVSFRLLANGEQLLQCRAVATEAIGQRIEECLGKTFLASCVPTESNEGEIKIKGFLGKPEVSRTQRSGQYLFVNGRSVVVPSIARTITQSYGTALPPHHHPLFVLYLELPGECVDVNVHPQKREVRLRHAPQIEEALHNLVLTSLQCRPNPTPQVAAILCEEAERFDEEIPVSFTPLDIPPTSTPNQPDQTPEYAVPESPFQSTRPSKLNEPRHNEQKLADLELPKPKLISCAKGLLLCSPDAAPLFQFSDDSICWIVVDQQRAHSRILFEQLQDSTISSSSEPLLIPLTVSLDRDDVGILSKAEDILRNIGVIVRRGGSNSLIVESLNPLLSLQELETLLPEIAEEIRDRGHSRADATTRERRHAKLARRAAISRTTTLTHEEGQTLLHILAACRSPHRSPSGERIAFAITASNLPRLSPT